MREADTCKRSRLLAGAWLIVVLALSLLFVKQGLSVQSDLLSLLPQEEVRPGVGEATRHFMKEVSQRVVLLVGAPSMEEARAMAQWYEERLQQSPLFTRVEGFKPQDMEAEFFSLYGNRREQFLPEALQERLGDTEFLLSRLTKILAAPLSGGITRFLSEDPLLFSAELVRTLPSPPGALRYEDGYLTTERDGIRFVFLQAALKNTVFHREAQREAAAKLDQIDTELLARFPRGVVRHGGALSFARVMADAAESDVKVISFGSALGTAALVVVAFMRLTPLLLSTVTVGIGLLIATALSVLVFGSVHALTLAFGATLIGVCADYSFHYFCHHSAAPQRPPREILHATLPAVTFGMVTSIIGYLGLLATPFPGLRQMSFFAVAGMVATYLSVVTLLPVLPARWSRARETAFLALSGRLLHWIRSPTLGGISSRTVSLGVCAVLVLFSCFGLITVRIDDDVRVLQKTPPWLQEEERQFRALVGGLEPGKFFVVQGKTPEEVLTRDAALREALRSRGGELVDSALSLSQFVPPVAAQERSLTAVKTKLNPNSILPALEELGLSGERYFVKLQQQPLNPLTVEEWVRHPFSAPFRALWLNQGEPGQGQGQKQKQGQPGYSALVLLLGVKDSAALRHFEREGVYYVDQLGEAATLLKRYRLEAGWFVAVCYFLVFLLLVYRYGVRRGATAMVPAVLAVGVNLGVQGVLGQPVNLFTLLANLIVLGLAIDYAVFLLEGAKPPTMMAILLSAVSTVLSFGLLALSQTAVLQFFGTSLFFGVIVAMVLAPMVIHDEQGR